MKIFKLFLAMFFITSLSFAQVNPIDFEATGNGADWTWNVFENDANPALEFVANPSITGINTSSTAAKFTALSTGTQWAGTESQHGSDIGTFTFSADNCIVKMMVYKSAISEVGLKFATSTGAARPPVFVSNTVINEWEELTFDFSNIDFYNLPDGPYDQIVVHPDVQERTEEIIIYFDNITFEAGTVTLATPVGFGASAAAGDGEVFLACGPNNVGVNDIVYKLFYSKTAEAPADPTTATEYAFGSTAGDGAGTGPFGFNLSGLDGGTSYTFWLYQHSTVTLAYSSPAIQVVTTNGDGPSTEEPLVGAPDPTQDESNVISLFSGVYTDVTVDTWRTDWSDVTYEEVEIDGNPTKKYTNLNFVGIETIANQLDILNTEMTHFHLHVWSPNFTQFKVKLVDFGAGGVYGGGDDTEHELVFETPAQGEWISLDIPLDDFINLTGRENIAQLIFAGTPVGGANVYVDNVFFYKEVVTPTYTVTFDVKSGTTPIEGAVITIVDVMDPLTTDASGIATIELEDGSYTYSVSATDYTTLTDQLFEVSGEVTTVPVDMTITSIQDINSNNISVYPNPAKNVLNINGANENSIITIFDISGKKLFESNNVNNQIDIHKFQSGIYTIQITDSEKTSIQNFIKN